MQYAARKGGRVKIGQRWKWGGSINYVKVNVHFRCHTRH